MKPTINHIAPEPTVTVVVLAFNQLRHTRRCLESIERHTRIPIDLVVVDNGSSDGTAPYLRDFARSRPWVRVVTNSRNLGFAAGNNVGLANARGDYVVLLNNDTAVTDGWVEGMLAVFDRNPKAGLVGPRSNQVSGPQVVEGVSYEDLESLPEFARRWSQEHTGQDERVFNLIGFCLMIKRELITAIGGLDEGFGVGNYEDNDYCWRAINAGFHPFIAHEVFIHHVGGQTFKGEGIDHTAAMDHGYKTLCAKWQPTFQGSAIVILKTILNAPPRARARVALPEPLTVATDTEDAGHARWVSESNVFIGLGEIHAPFSDVSALGMC